MTIGIYLGELSSPVDARKVEEGNPGIGGTEYMMLLLASYLGHYPQYSIYVLANQTILFDSSVNICNAGDSNLPHVLRANSISILIVKSTLSQNICQTLTDSQVKIIVWGHNYYLNDYANYVANNKSIVANVFVGKQLYDRYIDHDIICKSTVIYNMVPAPPDAENFKRAHVPHVVTYVGALIYTKGFHLLAKVWKDVLEEVPDAQLYVIGSGKLYDKMAELGDFGIANADYEKSFIKFLLDDNNKLLNSVKFLGVVSEDKGKFFRETGVGVINPSARSETFGLGIIEMNEYGIPVVTINKNGFPDTIEDNISGFLCKNLEDIKNKIIFLLKNQELNLKMGGVAKERAKLFSPEKILPQWIKLFNDIDANRLQIVYHRPDNFYLNNFKWLRILNRVLRFNCHLKVLPSILAIESFFYKLLR